MSSSFRSLLVTVALVFAVLFAVVALGQYMFVRHQLNQQTREDLSSGADELNEELAFRDHWDLSGYRRTSEAPERYLVRSENGTIIDTGGYPAGLAVPVSLPFRFQDDQPFRLTSDLGEEWLLFVHRLTDGMVILGVRTEVMPTDAAAHFQSNAMRFGGTMEQALRLKERQVEEAYDYAIVDGSGILRFAIGGIPLRTKVPSIPAGPQFSLAEKIAKTVYASLAEPVTTESGHAVGLIEVFEDVTDEQGVLRQSAIFNAVVAGIACFVTVAFVAFYLRRIHPREISCTQILLTDESDSIEFKSTLRWDVVNGKQSREMERVVVKAVAGFLNSDNGGTVVIGVSDKKMVVGLEADYGTLETRPNRDGFEQALNQILISSIGAERCRRCVRIRFCTLQGKEICLVDVSPTRDAVFLEERGQPTMYVRIGNTTRPLNVKEAVAYASARWSGPALHWPRRNPSIPASA
jgi:hypothetical protein